jgi:hypothetical protein
MTTANISNSSLNLYSRIAYCILLLVGIPILAQNTMLVFPCLLPLFSGLGYMYFQRQKTLSTPLIFIFAVLDLIFISVLVYFLGPVSILLYPLVILIYSYNKIRYYIISLSLMAVISLSIVISIQFVNPAESFIGVVPINIFYQNYSLVIGAILLFVLIMGIFSSLLFFLHDYVDTMQAENDRLAGELEEASIKDPVLRGLGMTFPL